MKNILLFMVALLHVITTVNAQDKGVDFKLQKDGSFLTEDGKDYEIVQYEGLSAHEIYQKLCSNAGGVYNNPNKVMSNVEDVSIKIRALSTGLVKFGWTARDAYYQFQIKIKDERVRVEAPIIENELMKLSYNDMGSTWWPKYANKWLKNEMSIKKNKDKIVWVEINLNSVINGVLGYSLTKESKEEDNW